MADIVEEWGGYLSTSRTNTIGVHDGGVATNNYASDVAGVADVVDVVRQTASSSPAALLFAYVLLRSVMVFCRFSLLQSVVEAMGFFVVVSRYIEYVVRECTVRESCTLCQPCGCFISARLYLAPHPHRKRTCLNSLFARVPSSRVNCFHRFAWRRHGMSRTRASRLACRVGPVGALVRDRRYCAGTTGGLSRQAFRRTVASVHQFLAQIHPPLEPPAYRWTNKSAVCGAVYITSAVASALGYGLAVAFTVFVAMSTWAAVGSFLLPAGHHETHAQSVSVDTIPATRIEADSYCMGGRRRVPCRGKTHRRYGRRRGSSGYLKKQLKKDKDKSEKKQETRRQRGSGVGIASVRGGAGPDEVRII